MMRQLSCLFLFCCLATLSLAGTKKKLIEMRNEGKRICRIRQATDLAEALVRDSFPHRLPQIGNYVAILQGNSGATVVCFQKNSEIAVLRFSFDEPFSTRAFRVDSMYIAASEMETVFLRLIHRSEEVMAENRDDFFDLALPDVRYRLIPGISKSTFTVYAVPVLQKDTAHILFGGDYLMRFDRQLRLLIREKLHRDLALVPVQTDSPVTSHEHRRHNKFMTATDYAKLLYVKGRVSWKEHAVYCRNRVFITEIATGTIRLVSRGDYQRGTQ